MSSIFMILTLLLWRFEISSSSSSSIDNSFGSRSILRANNSDGGGERPDFAVDLNATSFDAVLRETPASFAVVEFFAHWCPACRNYKPHYEKVARLFNGPDAVHPGLVLMARVDCASKINNILCDKFSVGHYPMLLWGPPLKFVSGGWLPNQQKTEIRPIDDGRSAENLLKWINKQLGSSYSLDDGKYENEHIQTNASDPGQIIRAVYDVEEATSMAFDIILQQKMIKSETRASLIKFLQLLVAHHPSKRCRKGSADILVSFDDLCPLEMLSTDKHESVRGSNMDGLRKFQICGKEVPRGYWIFCRGSKNDTRGFSCGLWVLLHSLSVRIEDGESHLAFKAICDFIHNFFICEECRQHFYGMCSNVSNPFNKTRDFALWLWNAHNQVNERLKKDEAALGTGDPKFPKIIWPPRQLCPACYLSESLKNEGNGQIKWDHGEVFKFLSGYYGMKLVTLYKEKGLLGDSETEKLLAEELVASTSAVVVPVGAALAIAIASCAFGALAYFWRSLQKNRKPRRSWNGFVNRADTQGR